MRNCPSNHKIAMFIDNLLSETEAKLIREHSLQCLECSNLIIDMLSLKSIEAEGLLPDIDNNEESLIKKTIEYNITREPKAALSVNKNISETKKNTFSIKNTVTGAMSGIAFGLSIAAQKILQPSGIVQIPSLAQNNENFFKNPVRNSESEDSYKNKESNDESNPIEGKYKMIDNAHNSWGLPPIDIQSPLVQQGYQDSCAIRSQQLILNDFGIPVTENELLEIAAREGWYCNGQGTSIENANKLLEYFGVNTKAVQNANIFSLTNELAQGHRVIVAVDSGELWNPGDAEQMEDIFGEVPDHALVVAGIDSTNPDNVTVQLMDPGTGQIAASYPVAQFMDAWSDSNCTMISTVEPAPPYAFGMSEFDYNSMHIPFVGAMSYEDYERCLSNDQITIPNEIDMVDDSISEDIEKNYTDDLLACIKGEISVPQMLENILETAIPNVDNDNIDSFNNYMNNNISNEEQNLHNISHFNDIEGDVHSITDDGIVELSEEQLDVDDFNDIDDI